jgi:hypothetical protein
MTSRVQASIFGLQTPASRKGGMILAAQPLSPPVLALEHVFNLGEQPGFGSADRDVIVNPPANGCSCAAYGSEGY